MVLVLRLPVQHVADGRLDEALLPVDVEEWPAAVERLLPQGVRHRAITAVIGVLRDDGQHRTVCGRGRELGQHRGGRTASTRGENWVKKGEGEDRKSGQHGGEAKNWHQTT